MFIEILFKIITDHSILKTLRIVKILKRKRVRWIIKLQQYNFTIEHRSEKKNTNADTLSRIKYKKREKK